MGLLPVEPGDLLEDVVGLGETGDLEAPFRLTIGPYVLGQLTVHEFHGVESVNDTYAYDVVFSTHLPLMLGTDGLAASLTLESAAGHEPRIVQGIVAAVEALGVPASGRSKKECMYQVTIVPKVWLLNHRRTLRYFQNKKPKEIVEAVLRDIGIGSKECKWDIHDDDYPALPFVYQRNETDYEFFRRVLSDAGIVFCFEHASGTMDKLLPGAGAIAGAFGAVADTIGGPFSDAVDEVGSLTKMLAVLRFTDRLNALPSIQDLSLLKEPLSNLMGAAASGASSEMGNVLGTVDVESAVQLFGDRMAFGIEGPTTVELADGLRSAASDGVGGAVSAMTGKLGLRFRPDTLVFDDDPSSPSDEERVFAFRLKKNLRAKSVQLVERIAGAAQPWAAESTAKFKPKANWRGGLAVDAPTVPSEHARQYLYQLDPNLAYYEDRKGRTDIELARVRVDRYQGVGQSDSRRLAAGYRVCVMGHPHADVNGDYIVTTVRSHGVAIPKPGERVYQNDFECIPAGILPLPPRRPRPVLSEELGRVVAPMGRRVTSKLDTNHLGYVHVRFDWEILDAHGTPSGELAHGTEYDDAVFVPVAQPWAGDGYGIQCLPREGMRVLIGFVEGQGERPFVKGCYYDAENLPPRFEETEQEKIGIFTKTLPNDGGHSEISISDHAGRERVHIRGQRDLDVHVLHEAHVNVGCAATTCIDGPAGLEITGSLSSQIGEDERHAVLGDKVENVGGGSTTTVLGARQVTVQGAVRTAIGASRTTEIKGNDIQAIAGRESVVVGTDGELTESNKRVFGPYRIMAQNVLVVGEESISLRVKDSEILITEETVQLFSKFMHAMATEELELTSAHGPALRLDESARIHGKEITVQSAKAGLKLTENAELVGSKVRLGKSGEAAKEAKMRRLKEEVSPIRVQHLDGSPLADATVVIVGPDGQRMEQRTDGDGWIHPMVLSGEPFTVVEIVHPTENHSVAFTTREC